MPYLGEKQVDACYLGEKSVGAGFLDEISVCGNPTKIIHFIVDYKTGVTPTASSKKGTSVYTVNIQKPTGPIPTVTAIPAPAPGFERWELFTYHTATEFKFDANKLDIDRITVLKSNTITKSLSGTEGLFEGMENLRELSLDAAPEATFENIVDGSKFMLNCKKVISMSTLKLTSLENGTQMFSGLESMVSAIPVTNTINLKDANMFMNGCIAMTAVPPIRTDKLIRASKMLLDCGAVTDAGMPTVLTNVFEFKLCVRFDNAFAGMIGLTTFPLINTGNASNMGATWRGCDNITFHPDYDTAKCTDFMETFSAAGYKANGKLIKIPNIDMGNGWKFYGTFVGQAQLTYVQDLNIKKATMTTSMFESCPKILCIAAIDTTSGLTASSSMFSHSNAMVNPTAAERAQIMTVGTGMAYVNSNPCP